MRRTLFGTVRTQVERDGLGAMLHVLLVDWPLTDLLQRVEEKWHVSG